MSGHVVVAVLGLQMRLLTDVTGSLTFSFCSFVQQQKNRGLKGMEGMDSDSD